MTKNNEFHNKLFDEGTKKKIEIFDKYLHEALPVFIHKKYGKEIFVYDLFAGRGIDENGEYGTALNILAGVSQHCKSIIENQKELYVILNDKKEKESLTKNVKEFLEKCKLKCGIANCLLDDKHLIIKDNDFSEYFNNTIFQGLRKKTEAMKLIFLDPYNFILDSELLGKLISLQRTDFMCFMPSTYLRRFKDAPAFKKFMNDFGISFDDTKYKESHRTIANYIKNLIPNDKEYYIGHFSIEKHQEKGTGKNYYGVIFGTNNALGAEKFQRVCWKLDQIAGEANYNIDNELTYGDKKDLYNTPPTKIQKFEEKLRNKILNSELKTDVDVYKYTLSSCLLPKHATAVLKQMMKEKIINEFKTCSRNIHSIAEPTLIELL